MMWPKTLTRVAVAAAVVVASLVGPTSWSHAETFPAVRSLIVKYEQGSAPGKGPIPRGAARVSLELRQLLRVGPELGLGMYRIDFSSPVSVATARKVARQLTASRLIELAEPDGTVTVQRKPRH